MRSWADAGWQGREGVPDVTVAEQCAQEPLHLGHGPHLLLHLCRAARSHLLVRLLPYQGEPPSRVAHIVTKSLNPSQNPISPDPRMSGWWPHVCLGVNQCVNERNRIVSACAQRTSAMTLNTPMGANSNKPLLLTLEQAIPSGLLHLSWVFDLYLDNPRGFWYPRGRKDSKSLITHA